MQEVFPMRPIRIVLGTGMFLVSSWLSSYICDVLGIDEGLSFLTVGGVLAFFGGMLFYSGVRDWQQYQHW